MPQSDHPPLQRHAALAPLSRDHYTGLVQSQRLMKAADHDDVARRQAVAAFVDASDQEIAQHFADEERLLTGLIGDDDRQRLLREHRELTEAADLLRQLRKRTDPDAQALRQTGQRLRDHIRWEERELFERLQRDLPEDQLAALARATDEVEQSRPRNVRQQKDSLRKGVDT